MASGMMASMLAGKMASIHALHRQTLSGLSAVFLLIPALILIGALLFSCVPWGYLSSKLPRTTRWPADASCGSLPSAPRPSGPPSPRALAQRRESTGSQLAASRAGQRPAGAAYPAPAPPAAGVSKLNLSVILPQRASVSAPGTSSFAARPLKPPGQKLPDTTCLCVELLVPPDNECSLMLPRILPTGLGLDDRITVDDSKGMPVFVALYCLSSAGRLARTEGQRLVLKSAVDEAAFAFCRDRPEGGLAVVHASGREFGALAAEGDGFVIRRPSGPSVHFTGDASAGSLTATDAEGRLLAVAEASGQERRCVRIGPRVDAGLMTLSMLAIDLLEHDRRMAGRLNSARTATSTTAL